MTNRRAFLKKQLILSGSVLFAASIDNVAKAAKSINVLNRSGSLNLLCSSNLAQLGKVKTTINNLELSSINLFAGSITEAVNDENLLQKLNGVKYHAVNFSLANYSKSDEALKDSLRNLSASFVNCNYSFADKRLERSVLPYVIVYTGGIKVGITGVGAHTKAHGISNKNPITSLNHVARYLREKQNCDKVICLADLGFNKKTELNNLTLAQASTNVNFVVGAGENPLRATAFSYRNAAKQEVIVTANKVQQRYSNLVQLTSNKNNELFNFNTKNI